MSLSLSYTIFLFQFMLNKTLSRLHCQINQKQLEIPVRQLANSYSKYCKERMCQHYMYIGQLKNVDNINRENLLKYNNKN